MGREECREWLNLNINSKPSSCSTPCTGNGGSWASKSSYASAGSTMLLLLQILLAARGSNTVRASASILYRFRENGRRYGWRGRIATLFASNVCTVGRIADTTRRRCCCWRITAREHWVTQWWQFILWFD